MKRLINIVLILYFMIEWKSFIPTISNIKSWFDSPTTTIKLLFIGVLLWISVYFYSFILLGISLILLTALFHYNHFKNIYKFGGIIVIFLGIVLTSQLALDEHVEEIGSLNNELMYIIKLSEKISNMPENHIPLSRISTNNLDSIAVNPKISDTKTKTELIDLIGTIETSNTVMDDLGSSTNSTKEELFRNHTIIMAKQTIQKSSNAVVVIENYKNCLNHRRRNPFTAIEKCNDKLISFWNQII